jgi:transcriptional regulator with XRE-family HTH domain
MAPYSDDFSLADWRHQREMTQAELADKLGMSDRSITRWESGEGQPGPHARKLLTKLTGATPEQLVPSAAKAKAKDVGMVLKDTGTAARDAATVAADTPQQARASKLPLLLLLCASSLLLLSAALLLIVLHRWH